MLSSQTRRALNLMRLGSSAPQNTRHEARRGVDIILPLDTFRSSSLRLLLVHRLQGMKVLFLVSIAYSFQLSPASALDEEDARYRTRW